MNARCGLSGFGVCVSVSSFLNLNVRERNFSEWMNAVVGKLHQKRAVGFLTYLA